MRSHVGTAAGTLFAAGTLVEVEAPVNVLDVSGCGSSAYCLSIMLT